MAKSGTSLIELGFIKEEELARFLGRKLAVPYVGADRLLNIPAEIIQLIPKEMALTYGVIPIHRDKKRLYLVMSDPADLKAIDDLAFMTGFIINPVAAPEVRLVQALGKYSIMKSINVICRSCNRSRNPLSSSLKKAPKNLHQQKAN